MSILDRYIARQFLFNLVMLFVVVCGLYFLLDLIVNFDEFVKATHLAEGEAWTHRAASVASKAGAFYWPRVFLLYTYMIGLLPVGAAGFTLAALIRNRELVAMMAGGVSLHRAAVPLIIITFAANLLLMANQELVLPSLASRLVEGHSKLSKGKGKTIKLRFTPDSRGRLFTTNTFDPAAQSMGEVTILVRRETRPGVYDRAVERITASQADWDPERGGWELTNGYGIGEEPDPPAAPAEARRPREVLFLPSNLDPPTILLRERERYRELLSLGQLGQLIGKPDLVDAPDLVRIRHGRFSVVDVNMLILLMGLSYFLQRTPGPLLVPTLRAAALCVPAWAGMFVVHQLSPDAMPPAAVAWLPVALYLPIAYYMMETVET